MKKIKLTEQMTLTVPTSAYATPIAALEDTVENLSKALADPLFQCECHKETCDVCHWHVVVNETGKLVDRLRNLWDL